MAIRISTVEEAIEDTGLKILVHGLAGSGKTILCATTNETTMIINVEAGMLSLRKFLRENPQYNKKIKVATIDDIVDLENLRDQFKFSEKQMCKWICIDSASEIAEQIIGDEKRTSGDKRAAYGNLTDRMMECFRDFRNLPGYNVVFTCKQAIEIIDEKPRYVPSFPGRQIGPAVPYLFDEVFALRVEEEPDEQGNMSQYRVLQTNRDVRYEAKDRSGELDMFEAANLEHIKNKIENANRAEEVPEIKQWEDQVLTDEEPTVFAEDSYFYHAKSDAPIYFRKGAKIPKDGNFALAERISKERYEELIKRKNNTTE